MEDMRRCSDCDGWIKSYSPSTCTCTPQKQFYAPNPEQKVKLDALARGKEKQMAKPLGERFRKGGRNSAFFPQLSGLARGLDKVIADTQMKSEAPSEQVRLQKQHEAQEKRLRKMARNKALAEKQK